MEIYLGIVALIVSASGTIWYRLGKLASEVRGHNKRLDEMDKKLEQLLLRR